MAQNMSFDVNTIGEYSTKLNKAAEDLKNLWNELKTNSINVVSNSWAGKDANAYIESALSQEANILSVCTALQLLSKTYQVIIEKVNSKQDEMVQAIRNSEEVATVGSSTGSSSGTVNSASESETEIISEEKPNDLNKEVKNEQVETPVDATDATEENVNDLSDTQEGITDSNSETVSGENGPIEVNNDTNGDAISETKTGEYNQNYENNQLDTYVDATDAGEGETIDLLSMSDESDVNRNPGTISGENGPIGTVGNQNEEHISFTPSPIGSTDDRNPRTVSGENGPLFGTNNENIDNGVDFLENNAGSGVVTNPNPTFDNWKVDPAFEKKDELPITPNTDGLGYGIPERQYTGGPYVPKFEENKNVPIAGEGVGIGVPERQYIGGPHTPNIGRRYENTPIAGDSSKIVMPERENRTSLTPTTDGFSVKIPERPEHLGQIRRPEPNPSKFGPVRVDDIIRKKEVTEPTIPTPVPVTPPVFTEGGNDDGMSVSI